MACLLGIYFPSKHQYPGIYFRSNCLVKLNTVLSPYWRVRVRVRCWICKTQAHWTDECQRFLALNPEERVNIAQENHACFSCLKRAGRDHKLLTCSRRKRCTETENGIHCRQYHHPLLHKRNVHVHRFLWRNLQTDREPDVYVKTVLTFGDKPAPAMAQIALRKTANEAREDFPEAAQILKDNTYMDDICDSVCTEEEARELTKCIDSVLETRGFKVKGCLSNKANSNTDQEERKEAAILQGVNEEKVLGVVWNNHTDRFTLKVKPELLLSQEPAMLSKRTILSQVARIYDPIGFASAFLIRAKIGLQELWEKGVGWDEKLPSETQEKWTNLFQEMKSLNGTSF